MSKYFEANLCLVAFMYLWSFLCARVPNIVHKLQVYLYIYVVFIYHICRLPVKRCKNQLEIVYKYKIADPSNFD